MSALCRRSTHKVLEWVLYVGRAWVLYVGIASLLVTWYRRSTRGLTFENGGPGLAAVCGTGEQGWGAHFQIVSILLLIWHVSSSSYDLHMWQWRTRLNRAFSKVASIVTWYKKDSRGQTLPHVRQTLLYMREVIKKEKAEILKSSVSSSSYAIYPPPHMTYNAKGDREGTGRNSQIVSVTKHLLH